MVKIYGAASGAARVYGLGTGLGSTVPFSFGDPLPGISSNTVLGKGQHVEILSPATVTLPSPYKGGRLVIRNVSGNVSTIASPTPITYKGTSYPYLDIVDSTTALLSVVDGVWVAAVVKEDLPYYPPIATGGTITEFTDVDGTTYRVHSFTTVGTSSFDVTQAGIPNQVEYLVVAGGGGGGATMGGGGGGGGFISDDLQIAIASYSVTVGSGGLGGFYSQQGLKGGNSVFSSIVAEGGGGGSGWGGSGPTSGGSGGGANETHSLPGSGIAGQGFAGGNTTIAYAVGSRTSGGGGGASEPGLGNQGAGVGCKGGDGKLFAGNYYAGGGGGGIDGSKSSSGGGAGGIGGGGAGSRGTTKAIDGTANSGGGGGGAGYNSGSTSTSRIGGHGGSGIVIVRYAISFNN